MLSDVLSTTVCVLALTVGCAKPPLNLPPEVANEWKINEVVIAIGNLQRTAIALNAVQKCDPAPNETQCRPLFSNANTRLTIQIVEGAVRTIEAAPQGWQATANAAVDQLAMQLDDAGRSTLAAYIQAARAVINAVLPKAERLDDVATDSRAA